MVMATRQKALVGGIRNAVQQIPTLHINVALSGYVSLLYIPMYESVAAKLQLGWVRAWAVVPGTLGATFEKLPVPLSDDDGVSDPSALKAVKGGWVPYQSHTRVSVCSACLEVEGLSEAKATARVGLSAAALIRKGRKWRPNCCRVLGASPPCMLGWSLPGGGGGGGTNTKKRAREREATTYEYYCCFRVTQKSPHGARISRAVVP